jgi:hypothetical protein
MIRLRRRMTKMTMMESLKQYLAMIIIQKLIKLRIQRKTLLNMVMDFGLDS